MQYQVEGKEYDAVFESVDEKLYKTGDKVKLLYNPHCPNRAQPADLWLLWRDRVVLLLQALIVILGVFYASKWINKTFGVNEIKTAREES